MSLRRVGHWVALLTLLTAACTQAAPPTTTTTSTVPLTVRPTTTSTQPAVDLHGGTIVIGISEEPFTLNPFFAGDQEPLVRLIAQAWSVGVQDVSGETGELIPEVVTRLPTVSNGGVTVAADGTMTVTYEIRPDAVWADGVPITGNDFQFTLDTILDPSLSVSRGVYEDILSSRVSEKTFSYTLAVPTIQYEGLFDVLLPAHDIAGTNLALHWNDRTWVSGGPFVFEEWVPGQSITFRRNDAYWKIDPESRNVLPFLDRIEFRFLPDPTERLEAFRSGAIDVLEGSEGILSGEEASALATAGAAVESRAGPVWVHLNFQFGPGRLNRNPDTLNEYLAYRQAIMHAVDRDRIAEARFGGLIHPLDSYVGLYNGRLNQDAWSEYPYDPARALELLAEADAERDADSERRPGDLRVIFTVNDDEEGMVIAELLGEMLAAVGIEFVPVTEDSLVFFGETVSDGRWDMAAWAWQASPSLAGLVRFHDVLDPKDAAGLTNFYRWGTFESSVQDQASMRYGQILEEMRTTVDQSGLAVLIREAETLIADQALFLPLYATLVTAAYWPRSLDGFVMNPTAFTWNIERWRVPS